MFFMVIVVYLSKLHFPTLLVRIGHDFIEETRGCSVSNNLQGCTRSAVHHPGLGWHCYQLVMGTGQNFLTRVGLAIYGLGLNLEYFL